MAIASQKPQQLMLRDFMLGKSWALRKKGEKGILILAPSFVGGLKTMVNPSRMNPQRLSDSEQLRIRQVMS